MNVNVFDVNVVSAMMNMDAACPVTDTSGHEAREAEFACKRVHCDAKMTQPVRGKFALIFPRV